MGVGPSLFSVVTSRGLSSLSLRASASALIAVAAGCRPGPSIYRAVHDKSLDILPFITSEPSVITACRIF